VIKYVNMKYGIYIFYKRLMSTGIVTNSIVTNSILKKKLFSSAEFLTWNLKKITEPYFGVNF
jgi:hypothetical protein